MPNLTLSIPDDLYKKLKNRPEIRWSEVARQAIHQYIDQLELLDKLTSKSQLTETDARELSEMIDSTVLEQLKKSIIRKSTDNGKKLTKRGIK